MASTFVRNQWALCLAQLFAGIGVATGFAVGGILAEQLTGRTELAGFAQTASILGAGLLALPLARLAQVRNRRWALAVGYGLALTGALLIVVAILAGIALGCDTSRRQSLPGRHDRESCLRIAGRSRRSSKPTRSSWWCRG
ncbi:hypothetical protein ACP6NG_16060, partial [Brevibacterium casei]